MSYKLEKPYTDKQRADFIVEYNHKQGLTIQETEIAIYALEPWEVLQGDEVVDNTEHYEQEQAQKERERLDGLFLTRGDVFEAFILAKGATKPQLRALIENYEMDKIQKAIILNRFDEALNFYRGYPVFNLLGSALGVTSEMLDKFFETNNYKYLTNVTLTINPTPNTATVMINGVAQNTVTVPYSTDIEYTVQAEGYKEQLGAMTLMENMKLDIALIEEEVPNENTTDTTTNVQE